MHYRELDQAWAELTAPGAPFEMTGVAVRGQALRVFKKAPLTVRDLWLSTQRFAERDYLVYQDERISYAEAHRRTAALGRWLFSHGVAPGDRVGIALRNFPEWMLIYWSCLSVGVAVVGLNAWWAGEEISYALGDSKPKVVFCDQERLDRILPVAPAGTTLVGVRCRPAPGVAAWAEMMETAGALPDVAVDPDADACIFYTSGTTGFPKGAQQTHRGCVTNLYNLMFAAQAQALALRKAHGGGAPPAAIPAALIATPLFHVSANNCAAYLATNAGGKLVLMHHWDPEEALRLIAREKITSMRGVPVMTREMINHPRFGAYDTTSVQSMGGGGAALPPDLVLKIKAACPGARPSTAYGMTETCGIISAVDGPFFIDKPTSVGRAAPTFDAACFDENGRAVAQGETGELWVRGPPVIKAYLNQPEASALSITDGWLHTGDIAVIDAEGFIHIVDRKKDMIIRGGENIYCAEVEACLYRHPAVAECSVFGVADERLGEEVGAAIFLRPTHTLSAEDLRAHCQDHIAKYKAPRFIWISPEPLPRNANGKILKRELRDTLDKADAR